MIITRGFTGTRLGMTRPQMHAVYTLLLHTLAVNDWEDPQLAVHHGDCTGADAEFHVIATVVGARTIAHPPVNIVRRAWCKADEIREPRDYLVRDWDIANETSELIATPDTPPRPGSGTWTTVAYAINLAKPVTVFLPDGTVRFGREYRESGALSWARRMPA